MMIPPTQLFTNNFHVRCGRSGTEFELRRALHPLRFALGRGSLYSSYLQLGTGLQTATDHQRPPSTEGWCTSGSADRISVLEIHHQLSVNGN